MVDRKMYSVRCNKCGREFTAIAPTPPTGCDYSTCERLKKQDITILWEKPYSLMTGADFVEKAKEQFDKPLKSP
jgi:hypothetical protein